MIRLSSILSSGILTLLIPAAGVQAQQIDASPAAPDAGIVADIPATGPSDPAAPGTPETPPTWQQEWTRTNRAGTVTNLRRQTASDDGSSYLREHVVTNPRGEMIQTWERSQDQEGHLWRRSQSFIGPDGTPLREHRQSVVGTDPYNYTREHQITLRDGRTISHTLTRSWDGTTGTMERTFLGPNGQTRSFQHAWAPDDVPPIEPPPTALEPPMQEMESLQAGPMAGRIEAVGTPDEAPGKWGWLEKLNPFHKRSRSALGTLASRPSPPRRAGFTVGSGGRSRISRLPKGLANRNPGQPSPKSHRPSWAGDPRLQQSPGHSGMTKLRANPGRGGNR